MSYYQGDYYRGDPFLGGLIGVGAKLISKAIPKVGKALGIGKKIVRAAPVSVGVGAGLAGAGLVSRMMGPGVEGRRRRMNVANPRALRRAIRRARGFAKLARKVLTFPISKPPRGRALFKKRSR